MSLEALGRKMRRDYEAVFMPALLNPDSFVTPPKPSPDPDAPFVKGDCVAPDYAIRAGKMGYNWAIFCETVEVCAAETIDGEKKYFITLRAARGKHAADGWKKVAVTSTDEVWNGTPVRKLEYRVAECSHGTKVARQ